METDSDMNQFRGIEIVFSIAWKRNAKALDRSISGARRGLMVSLITSSRSLCVPLASDCCLCLMLYVIVRLSSSWELIAGRAAATAAAQPADQPLTHGQTDSQSVAAAHSPSRSLAAESLPSCCSSFHFDLSPFFSLPPLPP